MSSLNRPVTRSIYAVVLKKGDPSPVAPESDEEKPADKQKGKDAGSAKEGGATAPHGDWPKTKMAATNQKRNPFLSGSTLPYWPAHPGSADAGPQLRRPGGGQANTVLVLERPDHALADPAGPPHARSTDLT